MNGVQQAGMTEASTGRQALGPRLVETNVREASDYMSLFT